MIRRRRQLSRLEEQLSSGYAQAKAKALKYHRHPVQQFLPAVFVAVGCHASELAHGHGPGQKLAYDGHGLRYPQWCRRELGRDFGDAFGQEEIDRFAQLLELSDDRQRSAVVDTETVTGSPVALAFELPAVTGSKPLIAREFSEMLLGQYEPGTAFVLIPPARPDRFPRLRDGVGRQRSDSGGQDGQDCGQGRGLREVKGAAGVGRRVRC